MAKIQSTGNTKWWRRYGATGVSFSAAGNVKWYTATLEDSWPISHKTNHTPNIQSSNLTPWHLHKGVENSCPACKCLWQLYSQLSKLGSNQCPSVTEWMIYCGMSRHRRTIQKIS